MPSHPGALESLAPVGWWRPPAEPWRVRRCPVCRMHLPRLRWLGSAGGGSRRHKTRPVCARAELPATAQQQIGVVLQQNGRWGVARSRAGFIVPGSWLESDMLTLAEAWYQLRLRGLGFGLDQGQHQFRVLVKHLGGANEVRHHEIHHDKTNGDGQRKPNENTLNCGAARVMMPIATLAISSRHDRHGQQQPSETPDHPTQPAGDS